jgi:ribosomal protein L10
VEVYWFLIFFFKTKNWRLLTKLKNLKKPVTRFHISQSLRKLQPKVIDKIILFFKNLEPPEVFKFFSNYKKKKQKKTPETEVYLTKAKNHTKLVSTLNPL